MIELMLQLLIFAVMFNIIFVFRKITYVVELCRVSQHMWEILLIYPEFYAQNPFYSLVPSQRSQI